MIEHLKSGLSISTHIGCPMKCIYCVLSNIDEFNNKVKLSMQPSEIVKKLRDEKTLFLDGETPLIINNRTDPFLREVKDYTLLLLEELSKMKIKSPVLLISKFSPPYALKSYFKKLNIMYFYSFSNIESDFNFKNVEKDISVITEIVPKDSRFHYFRPIIRGINDEQDTIIKTLKRFMDANFSGSVITGLRVTSNNVHLLGENIIYDKQHKFLESELFGNLCDELQTRGFDYPLYKHTSCAIATTVNKSNKLKYYGKREHCNGGCKNIGVCSQNCNTSINILDIEAKLGKSAQFKCDNGRLEILSEVSQEEIAYFKNAYGIDVIAKKILLSPSEREIQKNGDSNRI